MYKDLIFVYLQPRVNKNSQNLAILSLQFDGVTVKTSDWPIFAPVPSNSPRRLCESSLCPVSFSFLKWRIHRQTCLLTTLSQVLQFTRQHQ